MPASGRLIPVVLLLCAACGSSTAAPGESATRTYRMGFAPTPPQLTTESVLHTARELAEVSDITLVQQEVPWAALLDGTQTLAQAVAEREQLVDFLRSLDLEIVFLLDPLDGLDRRREPPDLVARGRSLREPEIRALHDAYALEIARRIRPAWYGLASEVNTLADLGDRALHAAVRTMINELAPQIAAAAPGTRTFVSFQADQAYGLPGMPRTIDHFALIDDYAVDALGLSTYPGFRVADPAALPGDFFQRFAAATSRPLLLVEGGWNSAATEWGNGTPAAQAAFYRRVAALLDGVHAELWVFLMYTDLDLPSFGLPPDRAATLANFAHMGIVDAQFRPKPAFAVWDSLFARRLR